MQLSTSVGWPIAKSAFADIVTKIEQGRISWDDPDSLWRARMDGKSDAFMGQSRAVHLGGDMNPRHGQQFDRQQGRRQNRFQGSVKEFTCNNYNNNYCKESQDHMDTNLPQKYIHTCTNCYGNPAIPAREQCHKLKHCKNTTH